MTKCIICKTKTHPVYFYERPPLRTGTGGGAGSYWCWTCMTKDFQKGDRVVMFAYERRGRSCRSVHNIGVPVVGTIKRQLDCIQQEGEWAQKQGHNAVHFYLYYWNEQSTESFSFWHENSMQFLEENLTHLREWVSRRVRPPREHLPSSWRSEQMKHKDVEELDAACREAMGEHHNLPYSAYADSVEGERTRPDSESGGLICGATNIYYHARLRNR